MTTTPEPLFEYKDVGGAYPLTGLIAVAIATRRPQLIDIQIAEIKAGKLLSAEHQITLLQLLQDSLKPITMPDPTKRQKAVDAFAADLGKLADQLSDMAGRVADLDDES